MPPAADCVGAKRRRKFSKNLKNYQKCDKIEKSQNYVFYVSNFLFFNTKKWRTWSAKLKYMVHKKGVHGPQGGFSCLKSIPPMMYCGSASTC